MQASIIWEEVTSIAKEVSIQLSCRRVYGGIFLMTGWCGRAQSRVGSATFGQAVLGGVRKVIEQDPGEQDSKQQSFMVAAWAPCPKSLTKGSCFWSECSPQQQNAHQDRAVQPHGQTWGWLPCSAFLPFSEGETWPGKWELHIREISRITAQHTLMFTEKHFARSQY